MSPYPSYDFTECNGFALSRTQELDELYNAVFKDLTKIEIVSDKERQLAGIDKIIHTSNGQINIDEKIERNNTDNIVFEDTVNIKTGKQGWLKDDALTDYVVFYKTTGNRVFFIPYKAMLAMYKDYREIWSGTKYEKFILNRQSNGYTTARIFVVPYYEVEEYIHDKGFSSEIEILHIIPKD